MEITFGLNPCDTAPGGLSRQLQHQRSYSISYRRACVRVHCTTDHSKSVTTVQTLPTYSLHYSTTYKDASVGGCRDCGSCRKCDHGKAGARVLSRLAGTDTGHSSEYIDLPNSTAKSRCGASFLLKTSTFTHQSPRTGGDHPNMSPTRLFKPSSIPGMLIPIFIPSPNIVTLMKAKY